jgi:hypothetical protein
LRAAPPDDTSERFKSQTASSERTRVRLIAFEDIKLGSERRDLVSGLIPRAGLVIVWGAPKSGKSFWIFDLAMHVALGWEYRGRRVEQGTVVYCAFEGQNGLKARVEAFRQTFLAEEPDTVPLYLQLVSLDLVAEASDLIGTIRLRGVRPALVVLDTLNRSLVGSESNDRDMAAYVRASDAIKEAFGCAVAIIHHSGVDTTRPRGHTSLTGAADVQISIKRDGADNIIATVELAKDGPQGEVLLSRLEVVPVGEGQDGELITSCVVRAVEGEPVSRANRVTGAAAAALDALQKALAQEGGPAPTGPRFPHASRVVPLATWRDYCDRGTVVASDNPDSRRKAFARASQKLKDQRLIDLWDGYAWLLESNRTART